MVSWGHGNSMKMRMKEVICINLEKLANRSYLRERCCHLLCYHHIISLTIKLLTFLYSLQHISRQEQDKPVKKRQKFQG